MRLKGNMPKPCIRISLVLLLFTGVIFDGNSQEDMTNMRLGALIAKVSDSMVGDHGRWQFYVKETAFICLTDSTQNRMRIISPIMESQFLTEDLSTAALTANFHTALDVKYAISGDYVWTTFIHPLKQLTDDQVLDAIAQLYASNLSFGTTFSSTDLVFPGAPAKAREDKKPASKKERF